VIKLFGDTFLHSLSIALHTGITFVEFFYSLSNL
jgi:hypothetical protein